PSDDRQRTLTRAAAYLARIPFAVSGQRGHDRTFHAACLVIKGFGLSVAEARPLLRRRFAFHASFFPVSGCRSCLIRSFSSVWRLLASTVNPTWASARSGVRPENLW